ncbi:MAG: hypothetical protein KF773_26420 [Deltaproteobacteria bacterium]|nr:hypothetical protein [Deltaproteobacteria bacterium]MCW5804914.1 hypothetical protein [Deltaproteobacteria bacterium]
MLDLDVDVDSGEPRWVLLDLLELDDGTMDLVVALGRVVRGELVDVGGLGLEAAKLGDSPAPLLWRISSLASVGLVR